MKIRLLFALVIVLFMSLNALADTVGVRKNGYVGIHGNISSSHLTDSEVFSSGKSDRNIDNGSKRNVSFSLSVGVESATPLQITDNKVGILGAFEIFYDNIDKIVGQGDTGTGAGSPRPRDNQPIYKSKYLVGARCKLGVEILQRVNVYGHLGLAYWGRDFYLDLNDTGGIKAVQRYGDDRQILGIYGLGGSVLLTEHWSVNINYTMARQHVDLPVSGMSTKRYFDPATVVKILSGGIIYHF